MWQPIRQLNRRLNSRMFRRVVGRSLALHHRGEVRPDGLTLLTLRNRLEIRWRARPVHPWDADLSLEDRSTLFYDQMLSDTEAVILRLFHSLPQIDAIDLTVVDPGSESAILEGRVQRSELDGARNLRSIRMRLRELGVSWLAPSSGAVASANERPA